MSDCSAGFSDSARETVVLRGCLARILVFEPIRVSRRMLALLSYLFEETLAGRGEELSQKGIAAGCFHLAGDYDSDLDSLVRVHASRLRRALKAYYAGPGARDEMRMQLATGGYVLVFDVCSQPVPTKLLEGKIPVIGLLEFKNLGLEESWRHLPVVLAEDLSLLLHQQDRLQVVGPFLRHLLESEGVDPTRLASRYPVDFVLDGSVQRKGASLILRMRLLEGVGGVPIWVHQEELEVNLTNIYDFSAMIPQQLSAAIGEDCGVVSQYLSSLARVKSEHSLSVFEAVLLGRTYLADFQYESLPQVLESLRQAVIESPLEAATHSTLVVILASLGMEPRWLGDPPLDEIRRHASEAVRLSSQDPWSILAEGFAAAVHGESAELIRIAVSLEGRASHSPSMLLGGIGSLLCYQNVDLERGGRLIEQAYKTNPHYLRVFHLANALVAWNAGNFELAERELDAFGLRWGLSDPLIRASMAAVRGDEKSALREWQRVLAVFPSFSVDGLHSLGFLWQADYIRLIGASLGLVGICLR